MNDVFFTSDTHFFHKNIIDYANRPFRKDDGQIDVRGHDEALVELWNAMVRPGDRVYHLGDLAFVKNWDQADELLSRLNGQKFWAFGNHDNSECRKRLAKHFVKAQDYFQITMEEDFICMSHYPFLRWNRAHYGAWMLHGHCHGELVYPFEGRILDVGVDCWGYAPVSYDTLKPIMDAKPLIERFDDRD